MLVSQLVESVRDVGWDSRAVKAACLPMTMVSLRRDKTVPPDSFLRRLSREVAPHFSKQVVSNKKFSLKLSYISNPARKVRAWKMSTVVEGRGPSDITITACASCKKKEAEINTETNCPISRGLLSRLEWNMQKQQLNVLAYTLFSMISGHLWH